MKTSKYWGVSYQLRTTGKKSLMIRENKLPWKTKVWVAPGFMVNQRFATEREAAIHADRINLEHKLGKPLNILKPFVK